jgi:hypothetical protein
MKLRLKKKMHQQWLFVLMVEVSQNSHWRRKIFLSTSLDLFEINSSNHENLSVELVSAITKYELSFCITKVFSNELQPWLSKESNMVIFKFWAKDYLKIKSFSANNPSV